MHRVQARVGVSFGDLVAEMIGHGATAETRVQSINSRSRRLYMPILYLVEWPSFFCFRVLLLLTSSLPNQIVSIC